MDGATIFSLIFGLVFGGVVLYFIVSAVRHGGLKGAMFGASIGRTVGEVDTSGSSFASQKIKVHVLEGGQSSNREIGLELVTSGLGSYSMSPISLSRVDAKRLATLLQQAIAE